MSRLSLSRRARRACAFLLVGLAAVITWVAWRARDTPGDPVPPPPVAMTRSALELREDQRLYVPGAGTTFTGLLVEDFTPEARKLEIEIRNGKAHGRSRGWFENGQIEVEETFVRGVSNGRRTRWYANGRKRAETDIVEGVVEGSHREWHDNGAIAVEMTLKNGLPDGITKTWHPSGAPKSRIEHQAGNIVSRESWPDPGASVSN